MVLRIWCELKRAGAGARVFSRAFADGGGGGVIEAGRRLPPATVVLLSIF
jgi:hypothetical protein